jgi:hypothetical protein
MYDKTVFINYIIGFGFKDSTIYYLKEYELPYSLF